MTSTSIRDTAGVAPTIDDARRRRAILWAVGIALMAVVASVTGLNVAQPYLATTFDISQGEVLWIINIYTLTLAAMLLPLGAAGDRWGRKPVLMAGLAVFGIANIAATLAPTVEVMLAARMLSGVGAALIMPVTLSVITASFPDQERSKAIGIWSAVAAGGGVLGMFLSALLVDVATWRWLFALPIVLTLASAAISLRSVPNSREVAAGRFDLFGTLTSIFAAVGFTYALHEAPTLGWADPVILITLAVAVAATAAFILWERHTPHPLLNVRLPHPQPVQRHHVLLILFGIQGGVFLVLYPFLQVILGWSGLRTTLGMMPMALLMMASSGLAPKLAARIGLRATMVTGLTLVGVGLASMAALVSTTAGYLTLLPGLIAMGLGAGLAMTPSTEAITSSLPRQEQGVASALNDLTRELGAALGIALLGGLLAAGYQNAINTRLDGVPTGLADTAREGIANATAVSSTAGSYSQQILTAAREAFIAGWQHAMWVGVAVIAALTLFILINGPKKVAATEEDEHPAAADATAADSPDSDDSAAAAR